jgi:8-oxo-dGTP diphosphatase
LADYTWMTSYGAFAFPISYWPAWDSDVEFLPGSELPIESDGNIYAVVVHAFFGDMAVMAEITGRGVCVPSGRMILGESVVQTAIRETFEETGGVLGEDHCHLIGTYRMVRREKNAGTGHNLGPVFYTAVFVAEVSSFEPIPERSESTGYFLLPMEDIADHYFMWNELLSAVFSFAFNERSRLIPAGDTISSISLLKERQ